MDSSITKFKNFLFHCLELKKLDYAVEEGLTWFTLELSFTIAKARAAHQVTVFCPSLPLFTNAVVVSTIVTPFCVKTGIQSAFDGQDSLQDKIHHRPSGLKLLTGRVTSEMSTSQAKTSAPEFEASLRHTLPFLSNIMVSGGEGVIT